MTLFKWCLIFNQFCYQLPPSFHFLCTSLNWCERYVLFCITRYRIKHFIWVIFYATCSFTATHIKWTFSKADNSITTLCFSIPSDVAMFRVFLLYFELSKWCTLRSQILTVYHHHHQCVQVLKILKYITYRVLKIGIYRVDRKTGNIGM